MFWRKRKSKVEVLAPAPMNQLAGKLGVERRLAVRVLYPLNSDCPPLPYIMFGRQRIKIHDLSVGGCCLLDANEALGPSVGNDIHLVLVFGDGPVSVHGRIVSRVDHKRHIQFLNLPAHRAAELALPVRMATRAQAMRSAVDTVELGPTLLAREIWSSSLGDSVVIEDHLHRLAQIKIEGAHCVLYKHAWPVKNESTPLTREEIGAMIIFMRNIPRASELLEALNAHIEAMILEGEGG